MDFSGIFDLDTSIYILLGIALVLALPGGLFIGYIMSLPRARLLSLLGGIVGDVVIAVAILAYLATAKPSIDGLSFLIGSFFACSMGVAIGALVINFLLGSGRRRDITSLEY